MSDSPTGKRYLGLAWNKTTATESNTASDYNWSPLYDNVEVGGRNLLPIGEFAEWGGGYTRNDYVFSVSQLAVNGGSGIKLPNSKIKPSTEYTLSFKTKKVSGDVNTIGGHTGPINSSTTKFYMDGNFLRDIYLATYPNDTEEHYFVLHFKSSSSVSDWIYIQPNRSAYDKDYEMEIWDIQLEKGNVATDWTPAPEDVDDKINQVESRVSTAEQKITDSAIVSTVTQSTTYVNDLGQKVGTDEIISRINQTAESIRIQANKIHIDGNTTFSSGYNPSEKETPSGAQAKVDAIEIGGRNYFSDYNGEENSVSNNTSTERYVYPSNNNSRRDIELEPNTTYTMSAWFRTNVQTSRTLDMFFVHAPVSGTIQHRHRTSISLTTEYRKHTFTFTTGDNPSQIGHARFDLNGNSETNTVTMFMKLAKLEKGNKATDWTPAPEDQQAYADEAPLKLWAYPDTTEIDGGNIRTNTITANEINVSSLSALSANLGTVTAGTINGVTINGSTFNATDGNGNGITISGSTFSRTYSEVFNETQGYTSIMTITDGIEVDESWHSNAVTGSYNRGFLRLDRSHLMMIDYASGGMETAELRMGGMGYSSQSGTFEITSFDDNTDQIYSSANETKTTMKLTPLHTNHRSVGMYGIYDSTKIGHVWSIGTAYKIPDNGSDFGNLYGIAYKHTNNRVGGTMAGGHQIVFANNGLPGTAIGLAGGIWTNGSIITHGNVRLENTGNLYLTSSVGGNAIVGKSSLSGRDFMLLGSNSAGYESGAQINLYGKDDPSFPNYAIIYSGGNPSLTLRDNNTYEFHGRLDTGNEASGYSIISPTANSPSSLVISIGKTLPGNARVSVTANSTVPGSVVKEVSVNSSTQTGFTAVMYRSDSTNTGMQWIAVHYG
jgi:hypothetical protein